MPTAKSVYTITTPREHFRYTKLPFGVSPAPGIFHSVIDEKVKDILHFCAYLDDILLTGKSRHEHLNALDAVLDRLKHMGCRQ